MTVTLDDDNIRFARTADGRRVAYQRFGAETGPALIHFHGGGSCRLEGALGDDIARDSGVQLLAYDRPGFGRSGPQPGRGFADAVDDALAVADAARVQRFAVSGYSSGVPHALAVATQAPERVVAAVLVNTAGERQGAAWHAVPWRTRMMMAVVTRPWFYRCLWWLMRYRLRRNPRAGAAIELFAEGGRQGVAAVLHELALCYDRPWGIDWSRLRADALLLQGARDPNYRFAETMARCHGLAFETIAGGHMDGGTPEIWHRACAMARREAALADAT